MQQTQLDGLRLDEVLTRVEVHRYQVIFKSGAALGQDRSVFRFHLQLRLAFQLGAQGLEPGLVNSVAFCVGFVLRPGKNHLLIRPTFLSRFRSVTVLTGRSLTQRL
jgi:hypothetical protein